MDTVSRRPLVEKIDANLSPLSVFELFRNRSFSLFLDSGMDPEKLGRYSFICSDPFLVLSSRGNEITITEGREKRLISGNPFDVLGEILERYRLDADVPSPVPFLGGAAGYFSYDLCHFIERLPRKAVDDLHLPECYLGLYDLVLAFDNLEGLAYIISTGFPELNEDKRLAHAKERLDEMKARLGKTAPTSKEWLDSSPVSAKKVGLKSGFTREEYVQAVEKCRHYIIAGDIFEVNLSQRFEAELTIPAWELYRRLRRVNPAPFACYLGFKDVTVVGSSPERFLSLHGDKVETRPIKGTRPRGKTALEDKTNAAELTASAKDRAENIMIVDLERNDLGRVCRYGTVKVTELAVLETFPTVFHLTSTVEGKLSLDKDRIDLLKAAFPGGSITGVPKVRAMEIIDELEPTRRSVYTGSIGYLSFNGDIDLNIAIRTFLIKDGKAFFQAGGAVTFDSDPESEYQETLDKVSALIEALNKTGVEDK